jgi:hypothetical protein
MRLLRSHPPLGGQLAAVGYQLASPASNSPATARVWSARRHGTATTRVRCCATSSNQAFSQVDPRIHVPDDHLNRGTHVPAFQPALRPTFQPASHAAWNASSRSASTRRRAPPCSPRRARPGSPAAPSCPHPARPAPPGPGSHRTEPRPGAGPARRHPGASPRVPGGSPQAGGWPSARHRTYAASMRPWHARASTAAAPRKKGRADRPARH